MATRPSPSLPGVHARPSRPPVPRSSLSDPDSLIQHASGLFIWSTMVGVWMISLLPWRQWQGAPDLLLLVIAYWSVHETRRVGVLVAFVFGLLMDVHDAGPLGQLALNYALVAYAGGVLHRRLLRFDLLVQALHMLPVFVVAKMISVLVCSWLEGSWPGWEWALSAALTALLWTIVGWLLRFPQHKLDDVDAHVQ